MANVKIPEREEFQYLFQITGLVNFSVNFYTLSSNKIPHFTTSANKFYKSKTDYESGGQAQEIILPKNSLARDFYKKFDKYHLKNLTTEEYNEIVGEIEKLKERYNFICKKESEQPLNNFNFTFTEAVDLSEQPLKLRVKRSAEFDSVKKEINQLLNQNSQKEMVSFKPNLK